MRNLKSAHVVNAGNLLKPELEGFLDSNLPSIHSHKRPQVYRKLKEALKKIKSDNIRGKLKLAFSVMYFIALIYFLTVLLT